MGSQPLPQAGHAFNLPTFTRILVLFLICLITSTTWAIQVTPNSECSSICMNDPTQDVSDPNVSSTVGSDIVCNDSNYATSAVGKKYKSCIECLQNSTAVGSGENDQAWFLYNLRFTLNTCLFATAKASDPISSPCSLNTVCGPIQGALQDGMSDPATMAEYSYCSAYSNSFQGDYLDACTQCLEGSAEQMYMSNFLIALHAGCLQKPVPGTVLGLNSTVFSKYEIEILAPVTASPKTHKKLSTGAIIGIAVAGVVLLIILVATMFICIRKRRNTKHLTALRSPLDSRFGAENITAPHKHDWSSPDYSPPSFAKESMPMVPTPTAKATNFSRRVPATLRSQNDSNPATPLNAAGHTPSTLPLYSPPLKSGRESIPLGYTYSPPQYSPQHSLMTVSPFASPLPPPSRGPPTEHSRTHSDSHPTIIDSHTVLNFKTSPASQHSRTFSDIAPTDRSKTSSFPPPPPPQRKGTPSQPQDNRASLNSAASASTPKSATTTTSSSSSSQHRGLPPRPHRTSSTSSTTMRSTASPVPTQKTNTTTRDVIRDRTARGNTSTQISGPIVSVESRFQDEDQAKKAREKLYKEGLEALKNSNLKAAESKDKAGNAIDNELW